MANSNMTKERQVPAGGVIYREGDPGNAVYVLQEGEVEILRETGGETQRLAVLQKAVPFDIGTKDCGELTFHAGWLLDLLYPLELRTLPQ